MKLVVFDLRVFCLGRKKKIYGALISLERWEKKVEKICSVEVVYANFACMAHKVYVKMKGKEQYALQAKLV